jgi:CheY-like chemotaxis protein
LTYRVLVVDDHEPWRRAVCSILERSHGFEIAGEARDGPEAIFKARTLRPDLILLDIDLALVNGIEAARWILADVPESRILFVSEHRSRDVVDAALAAGGHGYVIKSNAGRELAPAMAAVVGGRRYLSSGLHETRHEIGLYASEGALLAAYARLAQVSLEANHTFVIATSDSRWQQIRRRLEDRGIDVDRARGTGRYRPLDVSEVVSRLTGASADHVQFAKAAATFLPDPADVGLVVMCGDGAEQLLNDGHADAALRLEQQWDDFATEHRIESFCGYVRPAGGGLSDVLERIRECHSHAHTDGRASGTPA